MDKTLTTILLIIASVVAAGLVVNSTYPALVRSSNSVVTASRHMQDRIDTQVSIIYATGELDDSQTWQDTDSDTYFDVKAWVKNVGSIRILGTDQMDVFLGTPGSYERIPHADDAGGSYPRWTYTIENGTEWGPTNTIEIEIHYSSPLSSDTYLIKVITPSGSYDEHYFSF